MRYAVNLADMMRPELTVIMNILIGPVRGETVETDSDRFDETAVVLECPEDRGRAIVDKIRLRYRKSQLRCYESNAEKGGWRRR